MSKKVIDSTGMCGMTVRRFNSFYNFVLMVTLPISKVIERESFKVKVGSSFLGVWLMEKALSVLTYLLKRIIKKVDSLFDRLLISANDSFSQIRDYTPGTAEQELRTLRKFLPKLRYFVANLEKTGYFETPSLGEKAQLTLDKLYELEAELKILAFSNKKHIPTQTALLDAISEKSKEAISQALDKG